LIRSFEVSRLFWKSFAAGQRGGRVFRSSALRGSGMPTTSSRRSFIRLESSAMSKCSLDLNSGSQLPLGKYTIRELNLEIEVVSSDDNRYQFWII
jgi:hypothetical protein